MQIMVSYAAYSAVGYGISGGSRNSVREGPERGIEM